ncbi:MAG: nicotinate-nucleotide adenylyltransferase [Acidobacteriota bacterium]
MRIGIYGGTFNPPHLGHLITAEHVREEAKLDRILFIPSFISPHKRQGEEGNAEDRLAMTRLAIEGNPFFECSDYEVRKGDVSYTVETLGHLLRSRPDAAFSVIIGMDNYRTLDAWKDPAKILERSEIIVMNRAAVAEGKPAGISDDRIRFIPVPDIELSSSAIRRRVREGLSIRYLVPRTVEQYILTHHLYREEKE